VGSLSSPQGYCHWLSFWMNDLHGWDLYETDQHMRAPQLEGTVVRTYRGFYVVETPDEELLCGISSKLRKNLEYPEADRGSRRRRVQAVHDIAALSPVVVGDDVVVEPGEQQHMILEVKPRRTLLSRESGGKRYREQVIAANVDQVLAVVSTQSPVFDPELLDRVLCGAVFQNIEACVCVNKIDLGLPDEVEEAISTYPANDYQVIRTSTITGDGIDTLRRQLAGRTSVAVGPSGVGKSSLINALEPDLDLRVQPVNTRTKLGRHTTTNVALARIGAKGDIESGRLVDVPGLRDLSLWSLQLGDIDALFREFAPLLGRCRFGANCAHDEEPGCAIKEAVADGHIAPHRHKSYLSIWKETEIKLLQETDRRRPRRSS
jgi:ribosome biogenesis GTPase / thiamine phosphate phosphatase